jgi:hypothetical protein
VFRENDPGRCFPPRQERSSPDGLEQSPSSPSSGGPRGPSSSTRNPQKQQGERHGKRRRRAGQDPTLRLLFGRAGSGNALSFIDSFAFIILKHEFFTKSNALFIKFKYKNRLSS